MVSTVVTVVASVTAVGLRFRNVVAAAVTVVASVTADHGHRRRHLL